MVRELLGGIPDLTQIALEDLMHDDRPEVWEALQTALVNRRSVGITFAGFNAPVA